MLKYENENKVYASLKKKKSIHGNLGLNKAIILCE